MSKEVEIKLSKAKDTIDQLGDSFGNVVNFPGRAPANFADLMTSIGEFFYREIDDVLNAMDDAVDEIYRLDRENEELEDRIKELERELGEAREA